MSEKELIVKPKRTLSEAQLEKLKVARQKALQVKAKMKESSDHEKIKHYESKIKRIKDRSPEAKPSETEPVEEVTLTPEQELDLNVDQMNLGEDDDIQEQTIEPIITIKKPSKPKAKAKSKPVVIYEESGSEESDDEQNVIYIKRKGKSKKQQAPPQPPPQHYEPPPIRREVVMNPNPFYRHNLMPHYM